MTVGLSTCGLLIFFSVQGSHFKKMFIAEVQAVLINSQVIFLIF